METSVTCPYCGETFNDKNELIQHWNEVYVSGKNCGKRQDMLYLGLSLLIAALVVGMAIGKLVL